MRLSSPKKKHIFPYKKKAMLCMYFAFTQTVATALSGFRSEKLV
jgi:hypothetical protein